MKRKLMAGIIVFLALISFEAQGVILESLPEETFFYFEISNPGSFLSKLNSFGKEVIGEEVISQPWRRVEEFLKEIEKFSWDKGKPLVFAVPFWSKDNIFIFGIENKEKFSGALSGLNLPSPQNYKGMKIYTLPKAKFLFLYKDYVFLGTSEEILEMTIDFIKGGGRKLFQFQPFKETKEKLKGDIIFYVNAESIIKYLLPFLQMMSSMRTPSEGPFSQKMSMIRREKQIKRLQEWERWGGSIALSGDGIHTYFISKFKEGGEIASSLISTEVRDLSGLLPADTVFGGWGRYSFSSVAKEMREFRDEMSKELEESERALLEKWLKLVDKLKDVYGEEITFAFLGPGKDFVEDFTQKGELNVEFVEVIQVKDRKEAKAFNKNVEEVIDFLLTLLPGEYKGAVRLEGVEKEKYKGVEIEGKMLIIKFPPKKTAPEGPMMKSPYPKEIKVAIKHLLYKDYFLIGTGE
ncbi:MAG TPA: hypothetical protein EYP78_03170, partial [Candidatus Omnitrophica bacterium]|nr:hypothetical protein [Candidatus Omnitrophota bacterium]